MDNGWLLQCNGCCSPTENDSATLSRGAAFVSKSNLTCFSSKSLLEVKSLEGEKRR